MPTKSNNQPPKLGVINVPSDIENEQAVLGSMLMSPEACDFVFRKLTADDFYRPAHKHIFLAICSLIGRDEPVDLLTMQTELNRRKLMEDAGGMAYLTALFDKVPTAVNVPWYTDNVRSAAVRRDYLMAGSKLTALAMDPGDLESSESLMDAAEQIVFSARRHNYEAASGRLDDVNARILEMARQNSQQKSGLLGI